MANTDAPFGLRVLGRCLRITPYYILASYGTALFKGDPVIKVGTANTARVDFPGTAGMNPGTMPTINKATAGDGNAITGVIVDFAPSPNLGLQYQYNPASTERVALVADHPDQEFLIQSDTTGLAAADVGLNAVLIYTHSGSTTTGLSGVELDTTSDVPAADLSNQLTILRLWNSEDNETGAWCKAVVKINQHTEADNVIGI